MPPLETARPNSRQEASQYRVAIIGSGITGVGAATELYRAGIDFTVYEAEHWIGGHACTVDVFVPSKTTGEVKSVAVDAGFIVFNESTYPNLCRLFDEKNVPSIPSDMSFAVSIEETENGKRLEWGSTGFTGLFPSWKSFFRTEIYSMLADMQRFHKIGPEVLEKPLVENDVGPSLREYLEEKNFSKAFIDLYMVPMIAAVWSSSIEQAFDYPVRALFRFFHNHCFYQIAERPEWRTVKGGSREYVKRVTADFRDRIHTSKPISRVERDGDKVHIHFVNGTSMVFDDVIFAVHADTALHLLGNDTTEDERALLSAFHYAPNSQYMHTDARLMPQNRNAWASWNVLRVAGNKSQSAPVCVTYWMNNLQDLGEDTPDIFLTLNPPKGWEPREDSILKTFSFSHPQFNKDSIIAQQKLHKVQGARHAWFGGAWCLYGFHEDGLKSGIACAHSLLSNLSKNQKILNKSGLDNLSTLQFPSRWSMEAVSSTVTSVWRGANPTNPGSAIAPHEVLQQGFVVLLGSNSKWQLAKDTLPGFLGSRAAHAVQSFLSSLFKNGCLELKMPRGEVKQFGDSTSTPRVRLLVNNFNFFKRIALFYDIGLAEAYIAGDFDVDHPDSLVALFKLFIRNNQDVAAGTIQSKIFKALSFFGTKMNNFSHLFFRSNTIRGSKRNIAAHYDLSNDLFSTFLGNTMVYSSAYFDKRSLTLDDAQLRKLDMVIEKGHITHEDHVLEIGGGWGDFAIRCAQRTGCRVTSITISKEQYDFATKRIAAEGLSDRISFEMCDYRNITTMKGKYSRIVSIEMIEAVGHEYLPQFFEIVEQSLAPNGLVVMQAITMPEDRYENYRTQSDFINKHIFPGGCCPSVNALASAASNAGLTLQGLEEFAPHYAKTLRLWRSNFLESEKTVHALGFDEGFIRKWVYYLTYCEAGFDERVLGVYQLVFTRQGNVETLGGSLD